MSKALDSTRALWRDWMQDPDPDEVAELFFDHKTQGLKLNTIRSLKWCGLYEKMILAMHVVDGLKKDGSNSYLSNEDITEMWRLCNPKRLRAAGEPLPTATDDVILYRGLSGDTVRSIAGPSWTDTLGIACRFALRFSQGCVAGTLGHDPAVYTVTIPTTRVLAYLNEAKGEREFLYNADESKVTRMSLNFIEISEHARSWGWNENWKMEGAAFEPGQSLQIA